MTKISRRKFLEIAATGAAAALSFSYFSKLACINDNIPRNKLTESQIAKQDSLSAKLEIKKAQFSKKTISLARKHLLSKGIDSESISRVLSDERLEKLGIVKKYYKKQKKQSYEEYKKPYNLPKLMTLARQFISEWDTELKFHQKKYCVPLELSVSIFGIETRFGRVIGDHVSVNAFLSIAEDKPELAKFFLSELAALIRLCKKHGTEPFNIKGSYAGAIGPMQFMPSSLERYDFLDSGKDLFEYYKIPNSMALVFSYLSKSGASESDGYQLNGKNYGAAFSYNHSAYYARLVTELASSLKPVADAGRISGK